MSEIIREYVGSPRQHLRIDNAQGVLFGVKILGLKSKNNREYPIETLKKAMPLYEHARVNLDHPEGDPRKPRSYQDRLGVIRRVRIEENDGLFADFHFNPKHPLADQLLWDAEHAPGNVGFSHNVEAVLVREPDRTVVREIVAVRSVDLVADPATTSGLFESEQTANETAAIKNPAIANVETISDDAPFAEQTEAAPPFRESTAVAESGESIRQENAALRERTSLLESDLTMQERQNRSLTLLCETLAKEMRDDVRFGSFFRKPFLDLLLASPDEQSVKALLEDRLALVRQMQSDPAAECRPVSKPQRLFENASNRCEDTESFVRSITGAGRSRF